MDSKHCAVQTDVVLQESDFRWFVEHLSQLFEKYGHCYLAIKNKRVLGVFSSYADAVHYTAKQEPIGSFIVQECGSGEEVYTNFIASADAVLVTA